MSEILKVLNKKVELKSEVVELAMVDDLEKEQKKALKTIEDSKTEAQKLVDRAISILSLDSLEASANVEAEYNKLLNKIKSMIGSEAAADWNKKNNGMLNQVSSGATLNKKIANNLKSVKIK